MADLHRPRRHKSSDIKIAVAARTHGETERRSRAFGPNPFSPPAVLAQQRVAACPDPSNKLEHLFEGAKLCAQPRRIYDVLRRRPRCGGAYRSKLQAI